MYSVFGNMTIGELKQLIPLDSNKRDENHSDYIWAYKSAVENAHRVTKKNPFKYQYLKGL